MEETKKKRIYYYDNLKFILILLVVLGHFIMPFLNYSTLKGLFLFLYSFHMPLFIFVTGFFAKKIITADTNQRLNKILSYLIFYVGYKLAIFLVCNCIFHQNVESSLFAEWETPWYLLACVIWIIITNLVKNVKPIYMIAISLIFCLFIGYDSEVKDVLALSRVIVFFPFYLLGYYLDREKMENIIEKIHKPKIMILSGLFIILSLFTFVYFSDFLYFLRPLFTSRNPFELIDIPFDIPMTGAFVRLGWVIFCLLISLCIMSLIPRKKCFISKFGSRTLQVYVLHYFILVAIQYTFLQTLFVQTFGMYLPIFLLFLSIVATILLSNKYFEKPFTYILNLKYEKIYTKNN